VTGTTNTVNAATGQTYTIGNAYSLVEALPARHQPRASFMGIPRANGNGPRSRDSAQRRLDILSGAAGRC
jgi:hypothetical protein